MILESGQIVNRSGFIRAGIKWSRAKVGVRVKYLKVNFGLGASKIIKFRPVQTSSSHVQNRSLGLPFKTVGLKLHLQKSANWNTIFTKKKKLP
jgi:hypothetical protein